MLLFFISFYFEKKKIKIFILLFIFTGLKNTEITLNFNLLNKYFLVNNN